MDALERAIAKIEAEGRERAAQIAEDKAREVTVTVELKLYSDGRLKVTLTGIAPFTAEPSVGALTGVPGWTVLGQPYTSKFGLRSTRTQAVDDTGRLWGGLPLLNEPQARHLAAAVATALNTERKVA